MHQGSEELYQREGVWYARLPGGVRKSLGTREKAVARQRLKELKDRHVYGRHTWDQAWRRYFEEVAPGTIKDSVQVRYSVSLEQVNKYLPTYVDEITTRVIANVVSERKRQGVTNATIKRDLTAVSRVLSACVGWGWLSENAARNFDRSIVKERREPIVLPTEEGLKKVLEVAEANNPMAAALIRFYDKTGVRMREGSSLDWSQVDLRDKRITLLRTKTSRPRVIPLGHRLTKEAGEMLKELPKHPKSETVFWHTKGLGEPYKDFSSAFCRYAKEAGVSFSVHDLRHKFAVDYLKEGGNIYMLQKILGHSSIRTTELYLDYLAPEEQLAARYGDELTQ